MNEDMEIVNNVDMFERRDDIIQKQEECEDIAAAKTTTSFLVTPELQNKNNKQASPFPSSNFLQNANRKSAFQPYRQTATCTPLTNLQRGNTQAETPSILPTDINIHTLAGCGEITEEDVKNERDLNISDKDGYTPLHWASSFGQYNAVQLLLQNGAEVNKLGPNEETALHMAANGGHHEVIRLLISYGINVNHADHMLNTPLLYAAKGNHPHSCNELLMGGADLTMSNINDETAFTIALKNNCSLAQSVIQKHIISKFEL
ncbi:ankyrin repeat family A protein 2-like [Coccinella septempunctata]|uniref:ankyrin repeat family A protein 2-like n=1 Tax=Coccinella septempunctata TaxID=41139 RepID=UPI001D07684D|nr:ankyrin repeat family A protein 2-like [Coccinella septempunctata]